jgi:hypothetical protein
MFNAQAAISTVFFMAMILVIWLGSRFVFYNRWIPAKLFGFALMVLALAGIVSHVVALMLGA